MNSNQSHSLPSLLHHSSFDVWTSAIKPQSSAGRGRRKAQELYGIKKLRELILDLAVRGLLVPQDPEDEPASELLKKIAAEKNRLVKAGEIRKRKSRSEIKETEKAFSIPPSWKWIRLADVGHDWGQKKPDADFTYIDVGSIDKERGLVSNPTVLSAAKAPSRARKIIKEGTVIYSTVRPYLLNIAIVAEAFDPEPIASTAFAIIHPFHGIVASYVYHYLRSPAFIEYVESCQTGIAYPAINDKHFFSGLLPLPPLAAQHRIVAKVDELMSLCDQLEQQQEDSAETHDTLVQTLLAALTDSSDHDQFTQAWQQIASNFDLLFTTESSIDLLKQSILQLAVMGKLVEQNPEDEPASELLKKIAAEKEKLIKEGKLRKQKKLSNDIPNERKPFETPTGWMWSRLINVYDVRDGTHDTPKYYEHGIPLITSKNISSGSLKFDDVKFISEEDHNKISERSKVDRLDILFAMIGSIGNPVIVTSNKVFSIKNVALFKYYKADLSSPDYLLLFLKYAENIFKKEASGAVQSFVSLGKVREFEICLPPLTEQHRIVAKVDELLSLCDRLKSNLQSAQATQIQLADTLADPQYHQIEAEMED